MLRMAVLAEQEIRRRKRLWCPTFRGSSLVAQTIEDHEWVLAGPAETSKTWACMWRLDQLLRSTPGARAAVVRKVRGDMGGTVLQTFERLSRVGGGVEAYGGRHPEFYQYANGSVLYVGGMDRPGKVLSGERDWICVNQLEQLLLQDFETLTTRCTGRGAKTPSPMIFGDCNPEGPNHWILKRPELKVLQSRHEDNPSLYDDDGHLTEQGVRTMRILDSLTGVRKERLRYGRWVAAEGVVYDGFSRSIHLIARAGMPKCSRYVGSIDWGFTNPSVFQLWGIDHDGRMYLSRELYQTQRLVEDFAQDIKALLRAEGIALRDLSGVHGAPPELAQGLEAVVADHDAEDRATLHRHGIPTRAAIKEVGAGIQKVQARFRPAGDGKPRIYFLEDAIVERDPDLSDRHLPTCTLEELEVYAWPKTVDGKPLKEVPVDANNHGCDGTRYAVEYVDRSRGPEPSVREKVAARVAEKAIPVQDLTSRHQAYEAAREAERKASQRPRFNPVNLGRLRRGR